MPEQALELRAQRPVILDAVEVMTLRHPFDVQYGNGDRERVMAEDRAGDLHLQLWRGHV
jgi:hypothetical protein